MGKYSVNHLLANFIVDVIVDIIVFCLLWYGRGPKNAITSTTTWFTEWLREWRKFKNLIVRLGARFSSLPPVYSGLEFSLPGELIQIGLVTANGRRPPPPGTT